MCHAFCDGPRYVSSCWDHAMSDCWDHAMLRSGCVGAVLCGEADDGVLWLASLLRCGCVGTVLCGDADEEALWLVSLKGSWLRCGGCVLWFWWVSSVGFGGWVLWFVGDGVCGLWVMGFCGFKGVIFVVLGGVGYSVGISFAFEGDVL